MTRLIAALALSLLALPALGQIPDVQFKLDLGLTVWNGEREEDTITWYDYRARHSTAALQFHLEPGFRAYVAQRLQRIPHDHDDSYVDESYVEDEGVWRAGKQYLPFGRHAILRESVLAVRSDTELFLQILPMSIAACDGRDDGQQGVIGRIGSDVGVSFAFGRRFGIGSSNLGSLRQPEEPAGEGYRQVIGFDFAQRKGPMVIQGEFAKFERGEDGQPGFEAFDVTMTLSDSSKRSLTVGYASRNHPRIEALTLEGKFLVAPNVWLEPWYRTRDGSFLDGGVTARVRL